MKNEILLKRICKLIGMSYALSETDVWCYFQRLGSIDATIEEITNKK